MKSLENLPCALLLFATLLNAWPATLTLTSTSIRPTPSIVGYNSGHFVPGANTADWWRYAGVNGARVFITPSQIETSDDLSGRGDGVTDQASFLSRRNALRAAPLSPTYINWSKLTPRYGMTLQHGSNDINVDYACGELRKLGVQLLICLTASEAGFPINDANDWAGKWELWQHYYAQAFYLGREYQAQRFQMYNEPNHNGAITMEKFIERLFLIADAVQCAQADVNRIYGTSLQPQMFAPVTAGTAVSTYSSWGKLVVTNRHTDFLGTVNTNFWLAGHYNYHQYNSAPSDFGANLASLHSAMQADMSPEPRFPTTISEYNVHTASTFGTLVETLDSPTKYSRFGAVVSSLGNNGIDEMYCFKFSQTLYNDVTPIKKNGTHYVDNTNAPYNIGGATKAGETYRWWAHALKPGGNFLSVQKGAGTSGLYVTSSGDNKNLHLFSANYSSGDVSLTLDASAWGLPAGQVSVLREVSESSAGGVRSLLTNTSNGQFQPGSQLANTVWILSAARGLQSPPITLAAESDEMIADGTNRTRSYAGATSLIVENNTTNAAKRSAAYLRFNLPLLYKADIQFAVLMLHASGTSPTTPAQAHVYGITNASWNESTLKWANAPNVAQLVPAGPSYTNNFVLGGGASAFMAAQLTAGSAAAERLADVSQYVRGSSGSNLCFLIAREMRFHDEPLNGVGMSITSTEGSSSLKPRLLLIRALDSDNDGISDDSETAVFGTNPADFDTDNDGYGDGEEILIRNTDPGSYGGSAPTILQPPMNASVWVGETASFSVEAGGSAPLRYQWYYNATNLLAAATNSTLSLPGVQTNSAGRYNVIVTNSTGAATSSAAMLEVKVPTPPPTPTNILVPYEPFEYEEGSLLAGQGGWILNSASSAVEIEQGSLSAAELPPGRSNKVTYGTSTTSVRLPLGTNLNTGDVYYSLLLRVDLLGAFPGIGTVAGFADGTTTDFGAKMNIRTNGYGGYNVGTSKVGGSLYDWAPGDYWPGETLFLVARYRFGPGVGDDTCDVWINPDPLSYGAASPPAPVIDAMGLGASDIGHIDRFFLRGYSTGPQKVVVDELRLGYSWADVTTPAKPPMSISSTGGHLTIAWPASFNGYRLQECGSLVTGSWTDSEATPVVQGTNWTATVPSPGITTFYQLIR